MTVVLGIGWSSPAPGVDGLLPRYCGGRQAAQRRQPAARQPSGAARGAIWPAGRAMATRRHARHVAHRAARAGAARWPPPLPEAQDPAQVLFLQVRGVIQVSQWCLDVTDVSKAVLHVHGGPAGDHAGAIYVVQHPAVFSRCECLHVGHLTHIPDDAAAMCTGATSASCSWR